MGDSIGRWYRIWRIIYILALTLFGCVSGGKLLDLSEYIFLLFNMGIKTVSGS